MAKFSHGKFRYKKVSGRKIIYSVSLVRLDGTVSSVGTVEHRYFPHIAMMGWEASGNDGHRAVHRYQWQAAQALVVDLKNYPFPIIHRWGA